MTSARRRRVCPFNQPANRTTQQLASLVLVHVLVATYILVYQTPLLQRLEDNWTTETFNATDLVREFNFSAENDVLMFVQIQETGSTELDLHLVYDAVVGPPGKPGVKCTCMREVSSGQCRCLAGANRTIVWLVSAQSLNYAFCGVHRDWTELHDCVPSVLNRMERKKRSRWYYKE